MASRGEGTATCQWLRGTVTKAARRGATTRGGGNNLERCEELWLRRPGNGGRTVPVSGLGWPSGRAVSATRAHPNRGDPSSSRLRHWQREEALQRRHINEDDRAMMMSGARRALTGAARVDGGQRTG
jgi:hypothetical protein